MTAGRDNRIGAQDDRPAADNSVEDMAAQHAREIRAAAETFLEAGVTAGAVRAYGGELLTEIADAMDEVKARYVAGELAKLHGMLNDTD